jgi:hypothetical protein
LTEEEKMDTEKLIEDFEKRQESRPYGDEDPNAIDSDDITIRKGEVWEMGKFRLQVVDVGPTLITVRRLKNA